MPIDFSRYADNDTLDAALHELAEAHPQLCRIGELGRSHEGRPIWIVTITNFASGLDTEKPAHWMDGNLHATEVTGAMACLYAVNHLLTRYGTDPEVTRLLDETAFYIAPRLNPDGAHEAMLTPAHRIRSGTRAYPYPEKADGLHGEDIDGDGRILTMRVKDDSGDWRAHDEDPRLLVKRGPDEYGGTYYRLLPEGRIENYEPGIVTLGKRLEGLDFNRNFPFDWAPEGTQRGAGPFPLSEPETRAAVEFISSHPNINGVTTCHTTGGVLLRSFSTKADDQMTPEDLWVFQRIGRRGTELTGYPNVSTFHEFMYHPRELTYGAFDDWCYDHLGMFAWTVELWDVIGASGIKDRKFIEWYRDHPVEDDLKIMAWVDANVGPSGFVPWYPFEHPQLGPVELGGWDDLFLWTNPPPALLEPVLEKVTAFALAHAGCAPRLHIRSLEAEDAGSGTAKIVLLLENTGYLPTYTSKRAEERHALRPIRVELVLPDSAELIQGRRMTEAGQLEGRSNKFIVGGLGASPTDNRRRVEWVVKGTPGDRIEITAVSQRAGTVRGSVVIPG